MPLLSVACEGFRNLAPLECQLAAGLNLIVGPNGSGKTSLLEAIYFLGRTRSFRTHRLDNLIQTGSEQLLVRGKVSNASGKAVSVGTRRTRKQQETRLAGQPLQQLADLVAWFPIQVMEPDSHRLLDGGPGLRRQFLDWGVFHVKHQFYPAWKQYSKALKQRNAALRAHSSTQQIQLWTKPLCEAAETISSMRLDYLEQLNAFIAQNIARLVDLPPVEIRYRQGWPVDTDLLESLKASYDRERQQGYTRYGPHRADLQIIVDGVLAVERLSRGQQKQLIIALLLAQAQHYQQFTNNPCLFLVDDLPAELDPEHRERVLTCLRDQSAQLFVTSTDSGLIPRLEWTDAKMFHVEHGKVTEVVY